MKPCYNCAVMTLTAKDQKKKLRFIVVGCGYFGLKRIDALQSLAGNVHLTGVVDADIQKAKTIAAKLKIPYATSITALLRHSKADAAIISTSNNTHARLTVEALSDSLHVLCEKPLASDTAMADKIVQATKKYKRIVKTGSNHRFFPTVKKTHELFTQGAIGKLLHFRGSIGNNGSHTQNSWFWNKNISGGGTFIDNGCHLLDLARMFMGDFVSCVGHTTSVYWKKTRVEDVGTGIFITADQRQATISSSWIQWRGYIYFELWGDKGYIIVDSREGDRVIWGKRDGTKPRTFDLTKIPKTSYQDEIAYFIDCIQKGRQPIPSAQDGQKVIQMIEAVYSSAKKKKWVSL